MSDRDNFAGGFLAGAILGGVLGGILGATLTQRQRASEASLTDGSESGDSPLAGKPAQTVESARFKRDRPRWIRRVAESSTGQPIASEARIEEARRNLEHKITALNIAIDDARQQLGEAGVAGSDGGIVGQDSAVDGSAVDGSETDSPAA